MLNCLSILFIYIIIYIIVIICWRFFIGPLVSVTGVSEPVPQYRAFSVKYVWGEMHWDATAGI